METVLLEGRIRPAMYRLRPDIWLYDCPDRIKVLLDGLRDEGENLDPFVVQALSDLVIEEAEALLRWQEDNAIVAAQTKTDFQCFDFLAGDLEDVFLSVGNWVSYARDEPSGAVYDAEDLIERGAALRPEDFAGRFAAELQGLLTGRFHDMESAKRALRTALWKVKREGEFRGKDAIDFLRRGWTPEFRPEILVRGDLPLELASEIWKDGQVLRRGRHGMEGHVQRHAPWNSGRVASLGVLRRPL